MAKTQEPQFNAALGDILRTKHPHWPDRIQVEQTGVFAKSAGLRPDIVVRHPGGLPVVLETEFSPAREVEDDAKARLGLTLDDDGREIEQVIALRASDKLSTVNQNAFRDAIEAEQGLEFCLFSTDPAAPEDAPRPPVRWPRTGWITGNVDDLADCIELASLSENRVAQGLDVLEKGIARAAARVKDEASKRLEKIAETLHQEPGEQTTLMAMAIIANAFTFHLAILPTDDRIESPTSLWMGNDELRQAKILEHWKFIYENINYWPIFKIASDILEPIPPKTANQILAMLFEVASRLDDLGATSQHDLCGRMFQRLISDRKFLATFYTLPSSAALLAELAVPRLNVDWADGDAVCDLRIADFACGTGALLNAIYGAVAARHRRAMGDDGKIHAKMMEGVLFGTDIMPSATHLTATVLSSVHPGIPFGNTSIICLPYGVQPEESGFHAENRIALGALNLIKRQSMLSMFDTGRRQIHGVGDGNNAKRKAEGDVIERVEMLHKGFNLIIMNPPFTRPTGHESEKIGVPVPSFAGFKTSEDEQRAMSRELNRIHRPGMAGHGNAGLASNFIDIAHAKLRNPGGILALVLPASFLQGESWAAARRLLGACYRDIVIVSIAASGATDRAFSADTDMAEVLVVATRRGGDARAKRAAKPDAPALFVNLMHRPETILEAVTAARTIRRIPLDRRVGPIHIGAGAHAGCYIRCPLSETGCAGVRNPDVVQTTVELTQGRLCLPHLPETAGLPVSNLDDLGTRGLYHMDIAGTEIVSAGLPRGPFDIEEVRPGDIPTYPVLWGHDAKREKRLIVAPDKQGMIRPGCDERAQTAWSKTASRLHFNRDFRLNSQPLAACVTAEPSIGGRAWPNFLCAEERWQNLLVLWANTTLGLIAFWWIGSRQQNGRAIIAVSKLSALTVLDPRKLTEAQFERADAIFEAFKTRDLLPANEAWRDDARKELDRAVLIDLLGLPETILKPLDLLRSQWCAEPSVHGGKNTAPVPVAP